MDLSYFGDHEDNSWMELWSPSLNLNDDHFRLPGNVIWNPKSCNFIDPPPSESMNQPAAGGNWNTGITQSNHVNDSTANEVAPRSSTPRYIPPLSIANINNELRRSPNTVVLEVAQEGLAYMHARTPPAETGNRIIPRPSPGEWEKWKPELTRIYIQEGATLEETRAQMASKGFFAGATSYKRMIKKWGWGTYQRDKESGHLRGKASTSTTKPVKRVRRRRPSHPTTSLNESLQSNTPGRTTLAASSPPPSGSANTNSLSICSKNMYHPHSSSYALHGETQQENGLSWTAVAAFTPPQPPPTAIDLSQVSMRVPTLMRDNDFNEAVNDLLNKVDNLYISYSAQEKWKVQKYREIEEDDHDDLLVGIGGSLRDSRSISCAARNQGFQNALEIVAKVVGVGEGADCGLFSLPAIWISFMRLIRYKRRGWARKFLSLALKLAKQKFGNKHQFVQVLSSLQSIWKRNPDRIEEVVLASYSRCIEDVEGRLGGVHLTYLQLRSDFIVYLDGRSVHDTQTLVKHIRGEITLIEEGKGPDGGPNDDYIRELLGLMLYVLQSGPSSPQMADEAEKVAEDLCCRVEKKRAEAGGRLEGDLFITWKDLRQLLGKFCQDKGDYQRAIGFLEEFLGFDIEDERDTYALEYLERCYEEVGKHDAAKDVRQRRIEITEMLLRKSKATPTKNDEKEAGGFENTHEEDNSDLDRAERSSEATVGNQAAEWSEESPEEDITSSSGDREAEIQLLEEQITALQQRVDTLKREKRSEETL